MKIYTVTAFDYGDFERFSIGSFVKEEDAKRTLRYAENNQEYKDLEWGDFKLSISDIFESFEEFIEEE